MPAKKTCLYCDKPFHAMRRDAKFCSDSCRVSYSRLPSTFSTKAGNSWAGMADILELAKKHPEKTDIALQQLDWLAERLTLIRQLVVEYGEKAGENPATKTLR